MGKSGSGTCCSSTGIYGARPKFEKACFTKESLTPCIDVLTNFIGVVPFSELEGPIFILIPGLGEMKQRTGIDSD